VNRCTYALEHPIIPLDTGSVPSVVLRGQTLQIIALRTEQF
jgi:hypothetical protein